MFIVPRIYYIINFEPLKTLKKHTQRKKTCTLHLCSFSAKSHELDYRNRSIYHCLCIRSDYKSPMSIWQYDPWYRANSFALQHVLIESNQRSKKIKVEKFLSLFSPSNLQSSLITTTKSIALYILYIW